jgi:hypothetical protein
VTKISLNRTFIRINPPFHRLLRTAIIYSKCNAGEGEFLEVVEIEAEVEVFNNLLKVGVSIPSPLVGAATVFLRQEGEGELLRSKVVPPMRPLSLLILLRALHNKIGFLLDSSRKEE